MVYIEQPFPLSVADQSLLGEPYHILCRHV